MKNYLPNSVLRLITALLVTTYLGVSSASADLIAVPIGNLANSNARAYNGGSNYPIAPTNLVVGGVPFELTPRPGFANSLGIIQTPGTSSQFSLPTNVFGVATIYTLINSTQGAMNAANGSVEFHGTCGAFASFNLTQGWNIRDHLQGNFQNIINDPTIVTAQFAGGVRLDRQTFNLPALFATETLTEIRLVGINSGNGGRPFLAGATVQTIPEPNSGLLGLVVVGSIAWRRRHRNV